MQPLDLTQMQALSSSILSDIMDSLGLKRRAMKPFVRPIDDGKLMVGRARTGLYMPTYSLRDGENPYEVEIALVDDLKAQEVIVLACNGPTDRLAPWGELLSTAAKARGAAGALMDGCTRDVRAIRAMGFPVFHGGIAPLDSKGRGRIMALDVPVECAGVRIEPGDLLFGDADGIVAIPKAVEGEVLRLAFEKVRGEKDTLRDLQRGDRLADVFARYGIL